MERVLIVDDVLSARQSLAEVLEEKGFSTETAADGRGALQQLRASGPFSVVISDIQMPGMDGLDLVRRISEIDPTTITILLTGLASESRVLSALRAGAFDFLSKPYTRTELDQVLTRALERRKVILGNERYRHSLEQAVEERNSEITGTNQTLIDLYDLGEGSHENFPNQAGLHGFADYALRHFNADTFGILVLEDEAFRALAVRDRFGRDIDRALLETNSALGKRLLQGAAAELREPPREWHLQRQNRWARFWPFKHDSFLGCIYLGYDGQQAALERYRHVFELFRNRLVSHLKEHYMVRAHRQQLRRMFVASIQAHASSIEANDAYTAGHCDRVDRYAEILARHARNFDEDWIFNLKVGSILHDIGKIGIRKSILCKPGALTPDERKEIEAHPVIGSRIVGTLYGRNLESCVRHHHERFDGNGYPDGLAGQQIPMEARIVLLADSFDAMTSNRPYQRALSIDETVDEMRKCSGKQFDPNLVNLLIDCSGQLEDVRSGQAKPSRSLSDLALVG